jgi:uncharacterized protein
MTYLKPALMLLGIVAVLYAGIAAFVFVKQGSFLYFPSHDGQSRQLTPWTVNGDTIGYARVVPNPSSVWLMAHGNGGEAAQRDYILPCVPRDAAVYIVEYPGYGLRPGPPNAAALNRAIGEAYDHLVAQYPGMKLGVVAESIGSGPACLLARKTPAPRKIVLIVPFDTLVGVASRHMPWLPVGLLLRDRWDNTEALRGYPGPIEIYGARLDRVIPVDHAQRLAKAVNARFTLVEGGHNDWPSSGTIRLE